MLSFLPFSILSPCRHQRPPTPRTRPRPCSHPDRLKYVTVEHAFGNDEYVSLRTVLYASIIPVKFVRDSVYGFTRVPPLLVPMPSSSRRDAREQPRPRPALAETRAENVVCTSECNVVRARSAEDSSLLSSSSLCSAARVEEGGGNNASEAQQVETACTAAICAWNSRNHHSSTGASSSLTVAAAAACLLERSKLRRWPHSSARSALGSL